MEPGAPLPAFAKRQVVNSRQLDDLRPIQKVQALLVHVIERIVEAPLFHLLGKRVVAKEIETGPEANAVIDLQRIVVDAGIVAAQLCEVAGELRERAHHLVPRDSVRGVGAGSDEQRIAFERIRDPRVAEGGTATLLQVT